MIWTFFKCVTSHFCGAKMNKSRYTVRSIKRLVYSTLYAKIASGWTGQIINIFLSKTSWINFLKKIGVEYLVRNYMYYPGTSVFDLYFKKILFLFNKHFLLYSNLQQILIFLWVSFFLQLSISKIYSTLLKEPTRKIRVLRY